MAETAATAAPGTNSTGTKAAPLDEVMLAMDVVDTLRHREHLVARELAEGTRKESLIDRLSSIYAGQGIDVPDRILEEGVEALKKERFVYTPPPESFSVSLARLYVSRWRWGRWAGAGILALALLWVGYLGLVVWPAERQADLLQVELAETLPNELGSLRDVVLAVAEVDSAKSDANDLYDTGIAAARTGDVAAARAARSSLTDLKGRLEQEYFVRVVNRPNEQSGVWRIPDVNQKAKNFYLIVEAVGPDDFAVRLPIRSEETGNTTTVDKWGVRVPEAIFDRIRLDKRDDGIIQDNLLATKVRGYLEPDYRLPVAGGTITEW